MSENRPRYSRLAPPSIEDQLRLSVLAVRFFAPRAYRGMCELIGKAPAQHQIEPLDGRDFLTYLEKSKQLDELDRYIFRIRDLLSQLARADILTPLGSGRDPLIGTHYYFLRELTKRQQEGYLWLAQALGPEFILNLYSNVTLQLKGTAGSHDVHASTGIVIAPHWVLTCAHVVKEMVLDQKQRFGSCEFKVIRTLAHDKVDAALVEVESELPCLPGLAFRDPTVADAVYTLGYPRIPLSREPALVMQRGEVTSPLITTFSGEKIFLYSAIARPGNSGGPVIAANGHVVGIVTEELLQQASKSGMPFHAGIGTSELLRAISELEPSVQLPIELYE